MWYNFSDSLMIQTHFQNTLLDKINMKLIFCIA